MILFFGLTSAFQVVADGDPNKRYSRAEYIALWKDVAIDQMEKHGIPASITLAQAILESGDGNSELAREANNHFGIKCHDWTGKKVYHDDDRRNECFRKYSNANQSFEDHSLFLQRSRYQFLFDYSITDYKSWAKGLKKAGYATNPKYPELLIRLIEENDLDQYDKPSSSRSKKTVKSSSKQNPSEEIVLDLNAGSSIQMSSNRIKYLVSKESTTAEELSKKLGMGPWQIRKYNDLEKGATISEGDIVYLQPKRNKNRETSVHVVKEGETLRDVSQLYGVKMKKILKYSGFAPNYKPKAGDKLKLR